MLVQFVLLPTTLGTPSSCTVQHPFQGRHVDVRVVNIQSAWNTTAAGYTGAPVRLDFGQVSSEFQARGHAAISPGQGITSTAGGIFISGDPDSRVSRYMAFAPPTVSGTLLGTTLTLSVCDYDRAPGETVSAMASSALTRIIVWCDVTFSE